MKYFAHINENNTIQGWYTTDIHEVIPEPNIEVTKEQWESAVSQNHNHIASDGTSSFLDIRTDKEKATEIRLQRNSLLESLVDPLVSNPLRWGDLTETEKAEIATYRQELLNITEQASFPEVTWPTQPQLLNTLQRLETLENNNE